MKYLFSNGCSFLSNNSKHNIALNAGSELASMMGLEYINYAKGGRGNDRIVATTKTFFSKNKDKIKNTFALIGWSASLRIDYLCNKKPAWMSVKFDEELSVYQKRGGVDVKSHLAMRHINHILCLQDFFKINKIPYLMYNSLTNDVISDDNKDVNQLSTEIDKNHFFNIDSISHHEWCRLNDLCIDGDKNSKNWDEHPSEAGHIKWSNELLNYIKNKGILDGRN